MAHLPSKFEALGSNPSTAKKKIVVSPHPHSTCYFLGFDSRHFNCWYVIVLICVSIFS
jgi:hypothetical protein